MCGVNMKLTGLLGLALDCLIGMNVKMLGLLTRKTGTDVCGEHETDRPVRPSSRLLDRHERETVVPFRPS